MSGEFTVHKLNLQGLNLASLIAEAFSAHLVTLESYCGENGREMAIVRTKLEEACFFAKKAMAQNQDNQEQ